MSDGDDDDEAPDNVASHGGRKCLRTRQELDGLLDKYNEKKERYLLAGRLKEQEVRNFSPQK